MVATREKHRRIVAGALTPDETLLALVNLTDRTSDSTGSIAAQHYRRDNGIAERGINGVVDLVDIWLGLTERRVLVFTGSWLSLAPKPKSLVNEIPRDEFRVWWREQSGVRPHRLLHIVVGPDPAAPDAEHVVRTGESDDECDRFMAALGPLAVELAPA